MDTQPTAFITVFDVDPERQHDLLDVMQEGADQVIRHRPGFIGISLFASQDGRRIINVARWETADAAAATRDDPDAATYSARAAALGSPVPGVFSLAADIR